MHAASAYRNLKYMEEESQDLDVLDAKLHFSGKEPMELAALIRDEPYFYLEKVKYLPPHLYSIFLLSIEIIESPHEVFDAIDFVVIAESLCSHLENNSISPKDREVARAFMDNIRNNLDAYAASAPWHMDVIKLFENCIDLLNSGGL